MIVVCDGDKDGMCDKMECSHRGDHKYSNDCIINCRKRVNGKIVKFSGCKQGTHKIVDVDDLFEDIEL